MSPDSSTPTPLAELTKTATELSQQRRFQEAAEQFGLACALAARTGIGLAEQLDLRYQQADNLRRFGAAEAARAMLSDVEAAFQRLGPHDRIAHRPLLFDVLRAEGMLHHDMGLPREAAGYYSKILAIDCADYWARINMTASLLTLGAQGIRPFTPLLLSTLPRAGTWYAYNVFEFLEHGLGSAQAYVPGSINIAQLTYFQLGLLKCHLHAVCPGFARLYDGPLRAEWDEMRARVGSGLHDIDDPIYDPSTNDLARLVYLYRDPLDQLVSFYKLHQRSAGEFDKSLEAFAEEMLPLVIVQAFSFLKMAERFPRHIMVVHYHDMIGDPFRVFSDMLRFANVDVSTLRVRAGLSGAINASSIPAMRLIEERGGRIGGAPLRRGQSHMDGGAVGRGAATLPPALIATIETSLAEFGLHKLIFKA